MRSGKGSAQAIKNSLLVLSALVFFIVGCGKSKEGNSKEDQLKELRANAAATYILVQASSVANFRIIAAIGKAWVEYGVDGASNMAALGKHASALDEVGEFMNNMRPNQSADPELYEAVKDFYNVGQEVHELATNVGGYTLSTFSAKAKSLKTKFNLKTAEVERLMK